MQSGFFVYKLSALPFHKFLEAGFFAPRYFDLFSVYQFQKTAVSVCYADNMPAINQVRFMHPEETTAG